MSGSAPLKPLTLLGADGPACEGDRCPVPGAVSPEGVDSSPAPATDR